MRRAVLSHGHLLAHSVFQDLKKQLHLLLQRLLRRLWKKLIKQARMKLIYIFLELVPGVIQQFELLQTTHSLFTHFMILLRSRTMVLVLQKREGCNVVNKTMAVRDLEKRERRLGTKLSIRGERCNSPKCALVRKPNPPGMHGKKGERLSEFGTQLKEKQKIRFTYGFSDKQLK